jgi:hypothetical protein
MVELERSLVQMQGTNSSHRACTSQEELANAWLNGGEPVSAPTLGLKSLRSSLVGCVVMLLSCVRRQVQFLT